MITACPRPDDSTQVEALRYELATRLAVLNEALNGLPRREPSASLVKAIDQVLAASSDCVFPLYMTLVELDSLGWLQRPSPLFPTGDVPF